MIASIQRFWQVAVICLATTVAAPAIAQETLSTTETSLAAPELYLQTLRGTVWIVNETAEGTFFGTGWLVDEDTRLIITNDHVVEGTDQVKVYYPRFDETGRPLTDPDEYKLNADPLTGTVIDSDPERDLAIIQLEEIGDLEALQLAALDPLPAEQLHTVGANTRGSPSLWGYVSGRGRNTYRVTEEGFDAMVVENDLLINSGNSGGPLVNDNGEVVGVCFAAMSNARGVSLAIAASEVRTYLEEAHDWISPETAQDYNQVGIRHFTRERYQAAIRCFTEAIELDATDAVYFANRGHTHAIVGAYEEAIEDCSEAIRLDSNYGRGYRWRAIAYRYQGRMTLALSDIDRALELDDSSAFDWNQRGLIHWSEENIGQAIEDFTQALTLDASFAHAYHNRGLCYHEQGAYSLAVDDFLAALDNGLETARVYSDLGNTLFAAEQYDLAVTAYDLAIDEGGSVAVYFANRANALRELREFDKAIDDYQWAIQLDPTRAVYHAWLAKAYWDAGRNQLALTAVNDALALNDQNAHFYQLRSRINKELGNVDAAKADGDRAVQLGGGEYKWRSTRYLKVVNNTGETIRVHVIYHTKGSDGRWHWYPWQREGGESVTFEFAPGESAFLLDGDFRIQADKVRIWAEDVDSDITWQDANHYAWLVKTEYVGDELGVFTYTFK